MLYPPQRIQEDINVEEYVQNPTRIRRTLDLLTRDRNIADFAFGQSNANNGGIVYDRVTEASVQDRLRRTAEVRAPGAEFTKVSVETGRPSHAVVEEYGAETEMSWKAIQRNDTNTLNRRMNALGATVVRKIDRVAVQAISSDPDIREYGIDTPWSEAGVDVIGDIIQAMGEAEDTGHEETSYNLDTILINKADLREYLWANQEVREQLPREQEYLSPVLNKNFHGYLDLNWIGTNEVPRGTSYLLQAGISGVIGDEDGGIQNHEYDIDSKHVRAFQAWRTVVPAITDPLSIVRLTGFHNG